MEAARFRSATLQLQSRLAIRVPESPPLRAGYSQCASEAREGHRSCVSFPRLSAGEVARPALEQPEEIVDAMAHPDFEDATYT